MITTTALAAEPAEAEKVLPADLTPAQRANLILEPEFADAFYGQIDRQYLSGYWKFKPEINLLERQGKKAVSIDPKMNKAPATDPGLEQGYFKPEFDASAWGEIPVPWSWNIAVSPFVEKKTSRIAFAGLGYYRTTFQVPKEKKGKRVFIHFDSVQTECKVWLNGTPVGVHVNYSADAGQMLFADVIDESHPVQQNLQPGHWEVWNGETVKLNGGVSAAAKAVYTHYLVPLPEGVAISGGNSVQYRFGKNPIFGMVAGEVKVGKGLVFFSQALATSRYGKDPVATQYLRNVLEYTLGPKWTGERATAVK